MQALYTCGAHTKKKKRQWTHIYKEEEEEVWLTCPGLLYIAPEITISPYLLPIWFYNQVLLSAGDTQNRLTHLINQDELFIL